MRSNVKKKLDVLVQNIAKVHNINPECIIGKSKIVSHTIPRHRAWYEAREQFGLPYLELAEYFQRDHTTIIDGVKRTEERIRTGYHYPSLTVSITTSPHDNIKKRLIRAKDHTSSTLVKNALNDAVKTIELLSAK